MTDILTLTALIVALALVFDFINGFHDAANATATIVATRVLRYRHAVIWAAIFNFLAITMVTTGVAKTVGAGLMNTDFITPLSIVCALIAGITWNLATWYWGLPASSSHTLLGAYAGAVAGHVISIDPSQLVNAYVASGWIRVLAFIVIAPLVGFVAGYILRRLLQPLAAKQNAERPTRPYKIAQLASSALLSFNHGANDAQKTAGIITAALVAGNFLPAGDFAVPLWVLAASYTVIALGTVAGGWRVTRTMGFRLGKLTPVDGVAAETGAAIAIAGATLFALPISTTFATTGAITGTTAAQNKNAKPRPTPWPILRRIGAVWCITLPVSFVLGASFYGVVSLITGLR